MARILLVDDDASNVELLTLQLQAWGHEVDATTDVYQATGYLTVKAYDVVIADWKMPGIDGVEFIKWARTQKGGCRGYLLITGAVEHFPEQVTSADAEGIALLGKPFGPEAFKAKVDKLIQFVRLIERIEET